jgi:hypothetical protein
MDSINEQKRKVQNNGKSEKTGDGGNKMRCKRRSGDVLR